VTLIDSGNLAFRAIDDPRHICRDVTNVGRWGNEDVEVSLTVLDELPNVMGLVRQSLDKQRGAPSEENLTFKL
jgi:predicted transport protein